MAAASVAAGLIVEVLLPLPIAGRLRVFQNLRNRVLVDVIFPPGRPFRQLAGKHRATHFAPKLRARRFRQKSRPAGGTYLLLATTLPWGETCWACNGFSVTGLKCGIYCGLELPRKYRVSHKTRPASVLNGSESGFLGKYLVQRLILHHEENQWRQDQSTNRDQQYSERNHSVDTGLILQRLVG
jgi:hypothetical protein